MISGTCLCGALRYEADASPKRLVHCHCDSCRRHHGAPFATFVEVAPEVFRFTSSVETLKTYEPEGARARAFCGVCGSVAPSLHEGSILIPAGNAVGDLAQLVQQHFYVARKSPWVCISASEEQHAYGGAGWEHEGETPALAAPEGEGACLCGAVRFKVDGLPNRWMQCHCSRCRAGRSAAHGSNTFFSGAQFQWLAGRDLVRSYKVPEAQRFAVCFCERCGAGTPVERVGVPFVLVPAALFLRPPSGQPEAHIFVASKASWFHIADQLAVFVEGPPPA